MADLTIPQTNYAQKLKPYGGEIPSYIRAWDNDAKVAGLTIRRLHDPCKYGPDIVVVYSGTREQIEKSGLIDCLSFQRWPSGTRVPTQAILIKNSPVGRGRCAIFKTTEQHYALQIKEPIPDVISIIGSNVERFDFDTGKSDERNVFVGSKEKLLSLGLVAADMFPDDSINERHRTNGLCNRQPSGGYIYTLEETSRLYGDIWAYTKYPQQIKEHSEGNRSNFTSQEEWLEYHEDRVCGMIRLLLSDKDCSTITQSGMRYSIDPARMAEIVNEIEISAQKIRNLHVKVSRLENSTPNADARDKAAAASTDAEFQAFMRSAIAQPD